MGAESSTAGLDNLTERQKKWFATVKANFEAKTGKSIEDWTAIALTCPHSTPKARVDWLREKHGLGVNHAAYVLSMAFPSSVAGWDDPAALRAQLWKDEASHEILKALEKAATGLDGLVVGQRKGYTAFSRDVQFAATRPLKGGRALLGLKLDPALAPRLTPAVRKESWSERLSSIVELAGPKDVDAELKALFAKAYERG